jgi:polyhydroxybutyrate depolymerase
MRWVVAVAYALFCYGAFLGFVAYLLGFPGEIGLPETIEDGIAVSLEGPRASPLPGDTVQVGPHLRSFAFFAPESASDTAPLVLVLHGSGGSGARIRGFMGRNLERLAQRRGFVVAYPDGFEGHWNDCRAKAPFSANTQGVDDVAFLQAVVRRLREAHGVDPARVRVMGYSNGGHMALRLVLEAPAEFEAVAIFGASLPIPGELDCIWSGPPIPVLMVNGTADPISPYEGGEVVVPGFIPLGRVRSSLGSARELARRTGHDGEGQRWEVLGPAECGGSSVDGIGWLDGDLPPVVLLTVNGGGHTIPGPDVTIPERVGAVWLGMNERRFNAVEEALRFFEGEATAGRAPPWPGSSWKSGRRDLRRGGVDPTVDLCDAVGREAAPGGMLPNEGLIRGKVDTVDTVGGDPAFDPLDLGTQGP